MGATHAKWQVARLCRKLPDGLQPWGHTNIFVQIICALNYAGHSDTYLHALRAAIAIATATSQASAADLLHRISKSWLAKKELARHIIMLPLRRQRQSVC